MNVLLRILLSITEYQMLMPQGRGNQDNENSAHIYDHRNPFNTPFLHSDINTRGEPGVTHEDPVIRHCFSDESANM